MAVFINEQMIHSLHYEEVKQVKEKTTISLFGGVRARKWDRMMVKIKTDDPLKMEISEKSMFGVAITGQSNMPFNSLLI